VKRAFISYISLPAGAARNMKVDMLKVTITSY